MSSGGALPGTIRLMQIIIRWRSDQFQPTHIWNPRSNETDANLEDSACTVRVLLFFQDLWQMYQNWLERHLTVFCIDPNGLALLFIMSIMLNSGKTWHFEKLSIFSLKIIWVKISSISKSAKVCQKWTQQWLLSQPDSGLKPESS